jgi:CheY-like chemotaxis protein
MDLRMPVMDGVEATRQIARDHPGTAVLVLTMFDEDDLIAEAVRAGAHGYLLKTAEQEEIERAIRAVAAGEAIFSNAVAKRLLGQVALVRDAPALAQLPRANGKYSIWLPPAPPIRPSPMPSGARRYPSCPALRLKLFPAEQLSRGEAERHGPGRHGQQEPGRRPLALGRVLQRLDGGAQRRGVTDMAQ